jgi:protein O-mannosyl-transferase
VNPNSKILTKPKDILARLLSSPVVLSLLLVGATLSLYYPVHRYAFINFDDNDYVYLNRHVQAGLSWATVKWAFTTATAANWHPLTWLSHALDCQLYGLNPAWPHDVNVLFQALNAVLLFWVLLQATGFAGRSFMVAALFALHPINVESVAWISERKNVLSMMFFLLALGAYRRYASKPGVGRYAIVALLFTLGLMAKPQIITLPFVLLLWDYWPLDRMSLGEQTPVSYGEPSALPARSLSWLILEKVPLLVIAAASSVITMKVQRISRIRFSLPARIANAIVSYGSYVKKAVWPTHLAAMYPHPGDSVNWWNVLASGVLLLAVTALVIVGRRHRYLPVGWFWFLGTMVPMLGLVQVGVQAMADRYAYLPFLGLFILVCWGAAELAEHVHLPAVLLPVVSVAVLVLLAVVASAQVEYWQSDEALWTHALEVTTNNWFAESQLGTALAVDGRIEEAVPHFYKAIAITPWDTTANMGIAIYQSQTGNFSEAIVYYGRVIRASREKSDRLVKAWLGMGEAYRALGDSAKAQECLQEAQKVARR